MRWHKDLGDERERFWRHDKEKDNILPVNQIELVSILKDDEDSINGWQMLNRVTEEVEFGFNQAIYLLEHQEELSHSGWKDYRIVFPGALINSVFGTEYILCLCWEHYTGKWRLGLRWSDRDGIYTREDKFPRAVK